MGRSRLVRLFSSSTGRGQRFTSIVDRSHSLHDREFGGRSDSDLHHRIVDGGVRNWDAVGRYPDLFAAAVPICGGGDPSTIEKMLKTPIWAFHGGKDKVVLPQRSREMIDGLKKAGADPKYTEYPDAGHDSWTETYANPDLYRWMFGQRRKQDLPTEP